MIGLIQATNFFLFFGFLSTIPAFAAQGNHSLDLHDTGDLIFESNSSVVTEVNASRPLTWDQFLAKIKSAGRVTWGIQFDGRKPISRNADKVMLPASTLKVVTAITALKTLGRDFKFENSFLGIEDTVAHTLSMPEFKVSGDPTWGHEYYDHNDLLLRINRIVEELRQRRITKVFGPVTITSTAPELANLKRPAEDDREWRKSWRKECYATLPTLVTLAGNCATLKITGYKSAVWLTPGVDLPITVKLSNKGGKTAITPIMDSDLRVSGYQITGLMPAKNLRRFDLPVHQSETWLKKLFLLGLKRAGVEYSEKQTASLGSLLPAWLFSTPPNFSVDLSSPPLHEMLIPFVQESINIVGDRLFIEIARRKGSADPSQSERETILAITEGRADLSQVRITDGSGLRLDNQITPAVMKQLLDGVKNQTYFGDFFNTLAVAGESGTLEARRVLKGSQLTNGKIFGKTGTVNGVKNLVGYYQKPDQSLESFVFLTWTLMDEKLVSPMIDQVLVEFARQNSGLGESEKPAKVAQRR